MQSFGVANIGNGTGSVMLGCDYLGVLSGMKKGRNSPAWGQLEDREPKDTVIIVSHQSIA